MNENFAIQLFEGKKVRIVWDEEKEKYYFAVADIVQVLTDSEDVKQYIKRMRARDAELNSNWGTICTPLEMLAPDGKRRKTNAADLKGIFRIIQSIPSKKAEPVKKWLATHALTSKAVLVEASSPQIVHQTTSAPSRRRAPTRYHSQRRTRMSEIIPESFPLTFGVHFITSRETFLLRV